MNAPVSHFLLSCFSILPISPSSIFALAKRILPMQPKCQHILALKEGILNNDGFDSTDAQRLAIHLFESVVCPALNIAQSGRYGNHFLKKAD